MDLAPLLDRALENIYEGFSGVLEPNLMAAAVLPMNEAIGRGWASVSYNVRNDDLIRQLRASVVWFSKRKSWNQMQALAALMVSDDGKTRRSYNEFREAAQGVIGQYNERWLRTEYNSAARAARMAANLTRYAQTRDLYPNLRYVRTRSATPREEHLAYVGINRPFDDPFWDTHTPPLDFLCKCDVEPTDDEPTEVPSDLPPVPRLFQNNPYLSGRVFNEDGEEAVYPVPPKVAKKLRQAENPVQWQQDQQPTSDYDTLAAYDTFMDGKPGWWAKQLNLAKKKAEAFPNLDRAEIASVIGYTGNAAIELNAYLRGDSYKGSPQYWQAYTRVLNRALTKMNRPYRGILYRGLNLTDEQLALYEDHWSSGDPLVWKAFSSTSYAENRKFARRVYCKIYAHSGVRIEELSVVPEQKEVLLRPGAKLKVLSVNKLGKPKKGQEQQYELILQQE